MNSDIPEIIIKLRKKIADRSFQQLINEYYELEDKINHEKDMKKAIQYCIESLPLIEPLMIETRQEYGEWKNYSIPAITFAAEYYAIAGFKEQLYELNDMVNYFDDLKQHRAQLTEFIKLMRLADYIKELVDGHPGYIQKDLYDALEDTDKNQIDYCVRQLEKLDILDREMKGDSYRLTLKISM